MPDVDKRNQMPHGTDVKADKGRQTESKVQTPVSDDQAQLSETDLKAVVGSSNYVARNRTNKYDGSGTSE